MKNSKVLLISFLIVWGVLTRTVLHVGPNVEFVTAASLIAGFLFAKSNWAFLVPILIMLPSDLIIGNTNIFVFTWTGFLFPVVMGRVLGFINAKKLNGSSVKQSLTAGGLGIVSTLFFFLWTNFGHWLTTNMYSKDLGGLLQSYVNAIPFLKPQLATNLVVIPLFVLLTILILNRKWNNNPEVKLLNK